MSDMNYTENLSEKIGQNDFQNLKSPEDFKINDVDLNKEVNGLSKSTSSSSEDISSNKFLHVDEKSESEHSSTDLLTNSKEDLTSDLLTNSKESFTNDLLINAKDEAAICNSNESSDLAEESKLLQNECTSLPQNSTNDLKNQPLEKVEEATSVDILGNGLLVKQVLTSGEGLGTRPQSGDVVTIKFLGKLSNGKIVDQDNSLRFSLREGDVIQAFDLCVPLMQCKERCSLVADAKYAYGSVGRLPEIPPNSTLTYEIELLESCEATPYSELSIFEKIKLGNLKRDRGNYHYKRGDYEAAVDSYNYSLRILESKLKEESNANSDLQELLDTKVKCCNNLAATQLKIEAFDASIKSCDEVLKVQPDNVKAMFRKGKCLAGKGNISQAIALLKRAIDIEPETKIIHQELSKLNQKLKSNSAKEKDMYKRMMGQSSPNKATIKKKSYWSYYTCGAVIAVSLSVLIASYKFFR